MDRVHEIDGNEKISKGTSPPEQDIINEPPPIQWNRGGVHHCPLQQCLLLQPSHDPMNRPENVGAALVPMEGLGEELE